MPNLFFGDMLPPRRAGRLEAGDAESVLVGTASPVSLRVERIDHHLAPEGTVCIGSFLGDRMISRCAVPEETAQEFLQMELFQRPVALALNVRQGGPGVEGSVLALVPASEAMEREDGKEQAPWKRSVPGAGYDDAVAEDQGEGQLVGIFLGEVVRFQEDRKHPDNLVKEAADMLAGAVRGRIGKVVDRVIEDLDPSGPAGG